MWLLFGIIGLILACFSMVYPALSIEGAVMIGIGVIVMAISYVISLLEQILKHMRAVD